MDRNAFVDVRSFKDSCRSVMTRYAAEVSPTKKGARWELIRIKKLAKAPWTLKRPQEVGRVDLTRWKAVQTVSGPSLRREMVLLHSIFNYAIKEWGMPFQNPMRSVSLPADSKPRERRPSEAELGAIRAHFLGKRMGLLVELAIETAMRLGEMCSLTWGQTNISERYVRLIDTKNGHPRNVPLSTRAVALLVEARLLGFLPEQRVFPFSEKSAGVYWRTAMKVLEINDLHFHDLRHEATTRLAEKLTNVLELAAVTGHKDLKMLQRYYNPHPSALAAKLG